MKHPKTMKEMINVIKDASDIIGEISTYYGYMMTSEISGSGKRMIHRSITRFIPRKYRSVVKENVIFSSGLHQMPDKEGYYISVDTLPLKMVLLSYQLQLDLELPDDEYSFDRIASTVVHEVFHVLTDLGIVDLEPYRKLHRFLYVFYRNFEYWANEKSEDNVKYMLRTHYPGLYSNKRKRDYVMNFLAKTRRRRKLFPDGSFSNLSEFIANYESETRVSKDYPKLLKLFGG